MDRLILLYVVILCSCTLYAQDVRSLTKKEADKAMIEVGIRNLPEFFFDHYYQYPKSIKELNSFLQNHYDYIEAKEAWDPLIEYLEKNEHNIKLISEEGLFIICQKEHLSYNRSDMCSTLALHHPEKEYADYIPKVNFYDLSGRNMKELIGVERVDSIAALFTKLKQDVYNSESTNSYPEKSNYVQLDKFRRVLLQYELSSGLQTYCRYEPLILHDYPFFDKIKDLCQEFCKQQRLSKIIFNSLVFKQKEECITLEKLTESVLH